jgi:hypothetical protein
MPSWRRESARLWIIGRVVAAFGFLWASRRLVSHQQSRVIGDYGCAIAPLIAFALFWSMVYSGQRSNAYGRCSDPPSIPLD